MRLRSRMAALVTTAVIATGVGLGASFFLPSDLVLAGGDQPPASPSPSPSPRAAAAKLGGAAATRPAIAGATATPPAAAPTAPEAPQAAVTASATVRLQLQISGLAAEGCIIEVRPGHPGCKFKPFARQVEGYTGGETVQLDAIPVSVVTTSADRDCSFAITLREPGGTARTFRRGLRLNSPSADGQAASAHHFPVYLSSPSLAAQVDARSTLRR